MKASKSLPSDPLELWLASLSPGLRLAALIMSPDERARAFAEYQEALKMTPERLAACALHEHYPERVLNDPAQAAVYGVNIKTFYGMKERGEIPSTGKNG